MTICLQTGIGHFLDSQLEYLNTTVHLDCICPGELPELFYNFARSYEMMTISKQQLILSILGKECANIINWEKLSESHESINEKRT